ncbi:Lrp/AsnC family transcriptional regulator [Candidatus Woesearchaeota archaeon]|jgi:Lrp/AsnC family transcriptional regulator, leucine-responsive regulatory protein|nr:Lrp/AsnC family transcriptional regulator [Candidatus Woesearchaeota archaeon]MBT5397535.1 Lrp/AsnC family transcriptional regulator [Candidatus Woesearchaeota archaeon]MBT6367892.1 Lrp/AsnC family transcriptional regulator [Candidatus Woesearchaeota archaeon]MBT7763117.1 Lrp/AsnC family transcriptional regulator [Candidatus Woesearchaeota archaeon]
MVTNSLGSFNQLQDVYPKIDLKNKKLISHLLKNSRQSFSGMGKNIALSKESVLYRFNQLKQKNILLKTYAQVDYVAFGYDMFHILLLLDEKDKIMKQSLFSSIKNHPQVIQLIEYSGNWDIEIIVIAKNLPDFDLLCEELLESHETIILKKEREAVIASIINNSFPEFKVIKKKGSLKKSSSIVKKYDSIDKKILALLNGDARTSTYSIAPHVGLSADAVGIRIKKMVASSIILNYTSHLNFSAFGYQGYVFTFRTGSLSKEEERQIFYYCQNKSEVLSVKRLLGTWDIKMLVVVQNPTQLHKLILSFKKDLNVVIKSYQTWILFKEHYFNSFPKILLKE